MSKLRPRQEKPPGLEGRKKTTTCGRRVITLRHNVSQHSTGEKVWGPGANQIIPLEYWWLLSLTYAPRQLHKVFVIQHCLPLASSWWFALNTWLFLGLWNLTLFFPENLFHGNAFFFRRHLWFCWWSKSPVSRQLKAYVHPSGFSHMCIFFFKRSFCQIQCFDQAECLLLTLHTLKMEIFNYAKSFFWNTGLTKPFGCTWAFNLQYLNTDSPDQ